jgi:carboxymethylenebutenolidase
MIMSEAAAYPLPHYPPPGAAYLMNDIKAYEVKYPGYKGDPITAYIARPVQEGSHPGIIAVHGTHGYEEHMKDVARRLAALGYAAIVPALYSREPFLAVLEEADFKTARGWKSGRPNEQTMEDLEGAFTYLKSQPYVNRAKVGLIGFCAGGHVALLFACTTKGLSCFVDCYSSNLTQSTEYSSIPLIERVKDLCCPVLGLFGRDDKNPSPQDVERLRQELIKQGKIFEIASYKNAGHAFMSDTRDSYRPEAANAAWGRAVEWFANYLKP